MNNKNYFIFAAAIALASCSVDEYMGENPEFTQTTKENIIGFGGGTGSMSRATSNTGPTNEMLDNHFIVYGCKSTSTKETYQTVFKNYWVWYDGDKTTSNSDNWEYVAQSGKKIYAFDTTTELHEFGTDDAQYIKYWDYSADHYRFVAGTPQSQVTFNVDNTSKNVTGATVTGLAGHISPTGSATSKSQNPVYISAPIQINKKSNTSQKYGDPVQLTFTRLQTKVRVGIYETIPGYSIESITFYKQGASGLEAESGDNSSNVILTSTTPSYFNGGANVKATVGYTWTGANAPSYTVTYAHGDNSTGYESSNNWYGGKFSGVKATSSNPTTKPSGSSSIKEALYGTDNDMGDNGYFTVLSTTKAPSALVIKCDFTLTSLDGSGETIKVTGATAAIPAAYCKWDDNKMYTYIFKISQETNGHTGDKNNPGLFPITFDATAIYSEEGTETIVQTPSITTYQEGSVTDNGIEYKTGKEIVITVQDGSTEKTPNTGDSEGCVKVYYLGETEKTEAELVVTRPTTTTTQQVTIEGNTAKFIPKASDITGATATYGYYAIEYCYKTSPSAAYKYKVIKVKKVN